ncbi:MAG: DUF1499 domain-containing protein [Pseudomonadota bacterium]
MRILIGIIALAAFACGAAMTLAGPGAGLGWWEYGTSFKIFQTLAMPTMVAAGASLLAAVAGFFMGARGAALLALIAALTAAAGVAIPAKMRALAQANPFIHDITTDFENPPQIVAAADFPRSNPAAYVGDEPVGETGKTVAESQMEAFADITPILLAEDLETVTEKVRAAIDAMGLEVLAEGPVSDASGSGWRIEAVHTSTFFRFKDDFIVRLTSASEGGTQIDIRSKSRVGGSDLGANAARIRDFRDRLSAA